MPDITRALRGKRVAEVATNGNCVEIRCEDGATLRIKWVHPITGETIKGQPVAESFGYRMHAQGARELIHLPGSRARRAG